jgi:hypothetical protein
MNAVAAGNTDTQYGSIIDMSGFDGVMYVALVGDVTSTAVITLGERQATTNSNSAMTAVLGPAAQAAANSTSQDNMALILTTHKPLKRFRQVTLARATANIVVDGIIAIQYTAKQAPTTHDATTVLSAVQLTSPVES